MGQPCAHTNQRCPHASLHTNSIRTKLKFEWKFHCVLIVVLLLCLQTVQAVSFYSPIDCTHATSTCSTCGDVCSNSNQFHSLFPAYCEPQSMPPTYSSETHPSGSGPTLSFTGMNYTVPPRLYPPSQDLTNGFTVALHYRESSQSGTILQVDINGTSFTLQYDNTGTLVFNDVQILSSGSTNVWKSAIITFDPSTNVTVYFHNGVQQTQHTTTFSFPGGDIDTIVTGIDFFGLIQGLRIYTPLLEIDNGQVTLPTEGAFLPQCLCPTGYTVSEDMCINGSMQMARYRTESHVSDFVADNATNTEWRSGGGDSPVQVSLGFQTATPLSKIFVTFTSALPGQVVLSYENQTGSFVTLQRFALDCQSTFGTPPNAQISSFDDFNCLNYTQGSNPQTLRFYVAGTSQSPRPLPSDRSALKSHFTTSRIRMTLSDLQTGAIFSIEETRVCEDCCFDMRETCDLPCTDIYSPQSSSVTPQSSSTSIAASSSATHTNTPTQLVQTSSIANQLTSSLVPTSSGTLSSSTSIATQVSSTMAAPVVSSTQVPLVSTTVASTTSSSAAVQPSSKAVSTSSAQVSSVITTSDSTSSVVPNATSNSPSIGTTSSTVAMAASSTESVVSTSTVQVPESTSAALSSTAQVMTTSIPVVTSALSFSTAPAVSSTPIVADTSTVITSTSLQSTPTSSSTQIASSSTAFPSSFSANVILSTPATQDSSTPSLEVSTTVLVQSSTAAVSSSSFAPSSTSTMPTQSSSAPSSTSTMVAPSSTPPSSTSTMVAPSSTPPSSTSTMVAPSSTPPSSTSTMVAPSSILPSSTSTMIAPSSTTTMLTPSSTSTMLTPSSTSILTSSSALSSSSTSSTQLSTPAAMSLIPSPSVASMSSSTSSSLSIALPIASTSIAPTVSTATTSSIVQSTTSSSSEVASSTVQASLPISVPASSTVVVQITSQVQTSISITSSTEASSALLPTTSDQISSTSTPVVTSILSQVTSTVGTMAPSIPANSPTPTLVFISSSTEASLTLSVTTSSGSSTVLTTLEVSSPLVISSTISSSVLPSPTSSAEQSMSASNTAVNVSSSVSGTPVAPVITSSVVESTQAIVAASSRSVTSMTPASSTVQQTFSPSIQGTSSPAQPTPTPVVTSSSSVNMTMSLPTSSLESQIETTSAGMQTSMVVIVSTSEVVAPNSTAQTVPTATSSRLAFSTGLPSVGTSTSSSLVSSSTVMSSTETTLRPSAVIIMTSTLALISSTPPPSPSVSMETTFTTSSGVITTMLIQNSTTVAPVSPASIGTSSIELTSTRMLTTTALPNSTTLAPTPSASIGNSSTVGLSSTALLPTSVLSSSIVLSSVDILNSTLFPSPTVTSTERSVMFSTVSVINSSTAAPSFTPVASSSTVGVNATASPSVVIPTPAILPSSSVESASLTAAQNITNTDTIAVTVAPTQSVALSRTALLNSTSASFFMSSIAPSSTVFASPTPAVTSTALNVTIQPSVTVAASSTIVPRNTTLAPLPSSTAAVNATSLPISTQPSTSFVILSSRASVTPTQTSNITATPQPSSTAFSSSVLVNVTSTSDNAPVTVTAAVNSTAIEFSTSTTASLNQTAVSVTPTRALNISQTAATVQATATPDVNQTQVTQTLSPSFTAFTRTRSVTASPFVNVTQSSTVLSFSTAAVVNTSAPIPTPSFNRTITTTSVLSTPTPTPSATSTVVQRFSTGSVFNTSVLAIPTIVQRSSVVFNATGSTPILQSTSNVFNVTPTAVLVQSTSVPFNITASQTTQRSTTIAQSSSVVFNSTASTAVVQSRTGVFNVTPTTVLAQSSSMLVNRTTFPTVALSTSVLFNRTVQATPSLNITQASSSTAVVNVTRQATFFTRTATATLLLSPTPTPDITRSGSGMGSDFFTETSSAATSTIFRSRVFVTSSAALNRTTTAVVNASVQVSTTSFRTPSIFINRTVLQTVTPTPSAVVNQSITPSIAVNRSITPSIAVNQSITPSMAVNRTIIPTPSIAVNRSITPSMAVNQSITPSMAVNRTIIPSMAVNRTIIPTPSVVVNQSVTPIVFVNRTLAPTPSAVVVNQSVTPSMALNQTVTPTVFVNQSITPSRPSVAVNQSVTPSVRVIQSITASAALNRSVTVTQSVTANLSVSSSVGLNQSFTPSVALNQSITPTPRSVAITPTAFGNRSFTPAPSFVAPTSSVFVNSSVAPSVFVSQSIAPSVVVNQSSTPSVHVVVNQSSTPSVVVNRTLTATPSSVVTNQSIAPSVFLNRSVTPSVTQSTTLRVTPSARSVSVNQSITPSGVVSRSVTPTAVANQSVIPTPSPAAGSRSVTPSFRVVNQTSTAAPVAINITSTIVMNTTAGIAPSSVVLRNTSTQTATQTSTSLVQATPTVVNTSSVLIMTPTTTGMNVSTSLLQPTFTTLISAARLNTSSIAVMQTRSLIFSTILSQSVSNFSSTVGVSSTSASSFTLLQSARVTRVQGTTMAPVLTTAMTPEVSFTPTPTPLPPCPAEPLPPRRDSVAPIKVDLLGQGVVTSEVSPEANGREYSVSYNRLVSSLEGDKSVSATLGSAEATAALPPRQPAGPFSVTCAVSSDVLWPDVGTVYVAAQTRDSSFNTYQGVEIFVSYESANQSCTTQDISGVCSVLVNLTGYFTNQCTTIQLQVYTEDSDMCEMEVMLMPRVEQYSVNDVFMVLPQRPITAGEEVSIPVIAAFNTRVLTFSFNCSISSTAVIAGANSPFIWSRIDNYFDTRSEVFITGFRNYDKANTSATDFTPEELFSLVIANISSNVSVHCQVLRLQLTNLTDLAAEYPVVSATGNDPDMGWLTLESTPMVTLFTYTAENEVVNLAPLTSRTYSFPMYIVRFTAEGNIEDVTTLPICSTESSQVVKVFENCSRFYFDGTETQGASQTAITVQADGVTVSLPLRVWLASTDISITAEDTTLSAIETCSFSCSETLYQRTQLSIWTNISTGDSDRVPVSVTSLLAGELVPQDGNIVSVSAAGMVQGVQAGNTTISINRLEAELQMTVSDIKVVPTYIDLFTFSGINIIGTTNTLTLTLLQDFGPIYSPVYLVAVAQFDDNQTMLLTEEDGMAFEIVNIAEIVTGRYEIRDPVKFLNLRAMWSTAGNTCAGRVLTENTTILTNVLEPSIEVTLSSTLLTSAGDMLQFYDVPTAVYIDIELVYDSGQRVNITADNRTVITVTEGLALDGRTVRMDPLTSATAANITAMFEYGRGVNSSTIDLVTSMFTITAHPRYPGSSNSSLNELHQIGNSNVYQEAIIKAYLISSHNNIPNREITNDVSISVLDSDIELTGDNQNVLSVSSDGVSTLTLQAVSLHNSSFTSETLSLNINSHPVTVESIDVISMYLSTDSENTYHLDCSVTLSDNTLLPSTFTSGVQEYPNLIRFEITDGTVAETLIEGEATIQLIKNSPFTVTATAVNVGVAHSTTFYSNLRPRDGEVDIGNEDDSPIPSQNVSDMLEIPVRLNTPNVSLGVFSLELNMQPTMELIEVVQGRDWLNGSISFTQREEGIVQFGGVLSTGARELAEIAILRFQVMDEPGMVTLNVTSSYLSEADIEVVDISGPPVFSASQVEFEVTGSSGNRRRRSVETSSSHTSVRHRRQADPLDVNNDGMVDLRDVFILLEYIAAEAYNFTTDIGMRILGTTGDRLPDVDITTIEEVERTALDLAFTVDVVADLQSPENVDDSCILVISGSVVRDSGGPVPLDGTVRVVFLFEFANTNFQAEFERIFTVIESTDNGGLVKANLSLLGDGTASFEEMAAGNLTADFTLRTYLLVKAGVDIGNVTLSAVTSIDAQEVNQSMFVNVSNTCSPPSVPPSSTVAPSTSIQPSTTVVLIDQTSSIQLSTTAFVETTSIQPSTTAFETTLVLVQTSVELSTTVLVETTSIQPSTTVLTPSVQEQSTPTILSSSSEQVGPLTSTASTASSQISSTSVQSTSVSTSSAEAEVSSTSTSQVTPSSIEATTQLTPSSPTPEPPTTSTIETTTAVIMPESSTLLVATPTVGPTEQPTTSETDPTSETSDPMGTPPTDSSSAATIGAALGIIIVILLAIVVVFLAVYGWRRKRKRRRYAPNAPRPSSRASDFWFGEEEKVEMSPIDIVPLHHAQHSQMHETSIDLIPNHHIYHSGTGDDGLMSGHSGRPLLRDHPQQGRPQPQLGKQAIKQPFYSETGPTDMPASTYQTGATSRNTSSPYADYEEDELIDLRFNDDPANTYLSLGLTPLSQIDNYPASNDILESGSESLGFFPSMPPPVSPMSSVFSINTSGIPVDSPFNINGKDPMVSSSGGMVMPDAIPDMRRSVVGGRKGKLDLNPLSQGYPLKLETVPEQSGSLMSDNGFEGGTYNAGIIANGNVETSSSSDSFGTGEDTGLIFPSADASSSLSLQRQGGKRRKSGTRRDPDQFNASQEFGRGMVFQNRDVDDVDVDTPVKLDRYGSMSPASEDKYIRAKAREKEIAKQKELQKQRQLEDERRKKLMQEQRARQIASDYGSTRAREAGADMFRNKPPINYGSRSRPYPSNSVFREAMKLEAQIQMQEEGGPTYDQQRRHREQNTDEGIIRKHDQLTTL